MGIRKGSRVNQFLSFTVQVNFVNYTTYIKILSILFLQLGFIADFSFIL